MKPTLLLFLTACLMSCGKIEKEPVTVKSERDVLMEEYFKQIDSFDFHIDKTFYYSLKINLNNNTLEENKTHRDKAQKHLEQAKYWHDKCNESSKIIYP